MYKKLNEKIGKLLIKAENCIHVIQENKCNQELIKDFSLKLLCLSKEIYVEIRKTLQEA